MPQIQAEERLFPPISLEFLDKYEIPTQTFQETPIGGLSAITYHKQKDRFYALSDDRSQLSPARFYTLKIDISSNNEQIAKIQGVTVENVTTLQNEIGQNYSSQTIDPEGISLSPRGTVFISSEGIPKDEINPFIGEFNSTTGQLQEQIPLPKRYLIATDTDSEPRGVEENLGFEPLTISSTSTLKDDPFRLFTATESSLKQDTSTTPPLNIPVRLLHYVISPVGSPVIVAEHLYLLDETPKGAVSNGLTELLALPKEGSWLSLERTFGVFGFGAKLFQVVNSGASDTSTTLSFQEGTNNTNPLRKKLLLDLETLDIELDNLEGMTLGPRLADGSKTLFLISDDNFNAEQTTQLLLFKLS
ncbi:esterase-like activity of phytase family protein [Crocosphaera sp.]|uniref:esterase-like activity of phytase family protein n=1 Tax=Crocosphaera sp. TaxID=2729996 RepID=UPI00261CD9DB|nr:esterase-like activity of phytase family protein [Crocosphaera sp.]MDJ0581619.1 esterase-like activity of phytase family protein [Crocosphaera sp.]